MSAIADDLFACTKITPERVMAVLREHVGADHGIPVTTLTALVTGRHRPADQRQLRHVIEALRRAGHQVCAHPATGYYLAETDRELDATCEFLYSRAMTSLQQISAMKRVALPDLRGQLRLPASHQGESA